MFSRNRSTDETVPIVLSDRMLSVCFFAGVSLGKGHPPQIQVLQPQCHTVEAMHGALKYKILVAGSQVPVNCVILVAVSMVPCRRFRGNTGES